MSAQEIGAVLVDQEWDAPRIPEAATSLDDAQPCLHNDGQPGAQDDEQAAAELERLIQLRLSPDAMCLEIQVRPGTRRYPMPVRVKSVVQRAAALGIQPDLEERAVRRVLSVGAEKQWLMLATGSPPVAPIHGHLEVCVPSVPSIGKDRFRERAFARKGETLVRIIPSRDGVPGRNLKGRALAAAPARQLTVPVGERTLLCEDEEGPKLVAACDGMVTFDQMRFHVHPMQLVTAHMLLHGGRFETPDSVFVPDSVPSGAHIVAGGDLYVGGDVDHSTLVSTRGSITVIGCVTGHHQRHCSVRAHGDVLLASALYVDIKSGQDVYIQTQARNSTISAARHLILLTRLRSALYSVELSVDGAVIPADAQNAAPDVTSDERRDFDVACEIAAELGLWEGSAIHFHRCTILQLSVGAARLALSETLALTSNKVVYLKCALPGSTTLHILARTLTGEKDGQLVVGFRQVSHQDEMAVTTFCLATARARLGAQVPGPAGYSTDLAAR